jgi:hypothetical protein
VTFGAYKGATANVRAENSRVDGEVVAAVVRHVAYALDKDERWAERRVPGDPGLVERERVRSGELASWQTRSEDWWLEERTGRPWWWLGS